MRRLHFAFALVVIAATSFLPTAKGADKETASLSGTVVVNGKPLDNGRVFFHLKNGQFVGSYIQKNGTFQLERIPVGERKITVEGTVNGKPLPPKYRSLDATALRVVVKSGRNVFNIVLKAD